MLQRFAAAMRGGGRAHAPARPAVAPSGYRVFAVGDVHGRDDLLRVLLERISETIEDAPEPTIEIVFLGDYIDRGADVRHCIDRLTRWSPPRGGVVYLRGNHEVALLRFLQDPQALHPWLAIGGEATLLSYGVARPTGGFGAGSVHSVRDQLLQRLPSAHKRFFDDLGIQHRRGDLFFVHAGVRPGVALEAQASTDLVGIREPFLSSARDLGALVVHGHSITFRAEVRPNRVAVDSGAYATGVLTAAEFTEQGVRFLTAPA